MHIRSLILIVLLNTGSLLYGQSICDSLNKRIAFLWPFSSDSPWNRPIGSGAVFQDDTTIRMGNAEINANDWTIPVFMAKSIDPIVNVSFSGVCWGSSSPGTNIPYSLKMPLEADGSSPACPSDRHLVIVEPDGHTHHEFYNFQRTSDTTAGCPLHRTSAVNVSDVSPEMDLITGTGCGRINPLKWAGTRAYGGSAMAGLIRKHEAENTGTIQRMKHCLALALNSGQLRKAAAQSGTYKWPAITSDGFWPNYKGTVYMGELLAIPSSVNIYALGLSPDGLALAWTLQNFGCYVTDQGGWGVLYAEPGANAAVINSMRNDWRNILRAQLRKVVNNDSASVGGGGGYPSLLWPPPFPVTKLSPAPFNGHHYIPGRTEAEDYNNGAEGEAYHDVDNYNQLGQYRNDGVDIKTAASGGYKIGVGLNGEWLAYTIDSIQQGMYDILLRIGSAVIGNQLRVSLDSVQLGTVTVPNLGNWDDDTTVTIYSVPLSTGKCNAIRLDIIGDGVDINWVEFIPSGMAGTKSQIAKPIHLVIYPNPFNSGYLTISANLMQQGDYYLKMYDLTGRTLYGKAFEIKSPEKIDSKIYLENIPIGFYFVEIGNKNIVYREKFIKK